MTDKLRRLRAQFPWLLVVVMGGVALAQSNGGRDIPYVGFLDENGVPVSAQRALRVELFVSDTAPLACDSIDFAAIEVNAGRFAVELEDVPDACFSSGELYLEIAVGPDLGSLTTLASAGGGRQRVGTVPFAAAGPAAARVFMDDLEVRGDLTVGGSYGPPCSAGMTRVGAWCIDNEYTDDAAATLNEAGEVFNTTGFNGAVRFCHSEGKSLCPLDALIACDLAEPVGADCTTLTDASGPASLGDVWTSTHFLPDGTGTPAHDVFDAVTVFNGEGNQVSHRPNTDLDNEFWCCRPARY